MSSLTPSCTMLYPKCPKWFKVRNVWLKSPFLWMSTIMIYYLLLASIVDYRGLPMDYMWIIHSLAQMLWSNLDPTSDTSFTKELAPGRSRERPNSGRSAAPKSAILRPIFTTFSWRIRKWLEIITIVFQTFRNSYPKEQQLRYNKHPQATYSSLIV